ncbi:MOSC domain-containing protein [Nakamurella deserti]|uniref:MOSC domain-containing protein n=1 Tax=Nakamurella deserti TaxID=2164074 RepID=UPI0014786038|nr:MOSC domain-containing protein [Nakamurella deserti]
MSDATGLGTLLAVNVGRPRPVSFQGRQIHTAIFKDTVDGPVGVVDGSLAGDRQGDQVNHGGHAKAVYLYPHAHYRFWAGELGGLPPGTGVFGENLTVEGFDENDLLIGDVLQIGSMRLTVTEPRYPCFKLGIRLDRPDVVDRFVQINRVGAYLAIDSPGEVTAGDTIHRIRVDPAGLTVAELMRLRALSGPEDIDAVRRALDVPALTAEWRGHLQRRLRDLTRGRAPGWPGTRPFVVQESRREADDVVALTLVPRDGRPLPGHRPGQFVAVEVPGVPPVVRCYSLYDRPGRPHLRVAVKQLDVATPGGGVSARLHGLAPGDELQLRAPAGSFTPDPTATRPLVLVAGGVGVTPIHAIADTITAAAGSATAADATAADATAADPTAADPTATAAVGTARPTHVFYGARRPGLDPLAASLAALAAGGAFRLHVRYSRDSATAPARVTAAEIVATVGTTDVEVLVCGPTGMVTTLPHDLANLGVPAHLIRVEAFGGDATRALAAAVTVPPGGRGVRFARSGIGTRWQRADQTLLELAETTGLSPAFSCRTGSCGSCETTVESGTVAHLRPPGVDLDPDRCLTCIAVPTGDVVLDL